jgi:hypothetical protein
VGEDHGASRCIIQRGEPVSESTIHIPHKIGSEQTFAAICAALMKEGIRFDA